MTPDECQTLYMQLKLHFKSKTFNFHTSKLRRSTKKKPYYTILEYLSTKYSASMFVKMYVANILVDDSFFISAMNSTEAKNVYEDWKKRVSNKEELLLEDLRKLKKASIDILDKSILLYPLICKKLITWETLVVINNVFSILQDRPIPTSELEQILEETVVLKAIKYSAFLTPLDETVVKNSINYMRVS